MARPLKNTEQITLRVQKEWLLELDEIAKKIGPAFSSGRPFGRTDALRLVLVKGLEIYRSRGIPPVEEGVRIFMRFPKGGELNWVKKEGEDDDRK